jgi:hypothetical protein
MTLRAVIPYAPKEKSTGCEADIVDQAGNAILEFVKHAGGTTEADLQEAREAAEYLADRLRAAIKLGQIEPRNGCVKFPQRSSKETMVARTPARFFANERLIGDHSQSSSASRRSGGK